MTDNVVPFKRRSEHPELVDELWGCTDPALYARRMMDTLDSLKIRILCPPDAVDAVERVLELMFDMAIYHAGQAETIRP